MAVIEHPVHQILVASDFSESAEGALGIAVQYARALHARLHLLHVFAPGEIEVTQLLADAASRAGPDVPVSVAGAGGDPPAEILRYAATHSIDLIVVGTHGRTGVSRLLLGSVAERVLRGASCPVLVVPMPHLRVTLEPSTPSGVAADDEEAETSTPERPCLVCATPSRDLICEPCRARIRGEALAHKQREERPGRR